MVQKNRAIALMMEAASTSETLVNFYQTTQCNNPEDSHLHTRRRENLKSHFTKKTAVAVVFVTRPNSYSFMFSSFLYNISNALFENEAVKAPPTS
jgi:hypothetical protein